MSAPVRPALQRRLGGVGLFTLAFGSMIGVGWVTGMGGWLTQAGPFGASVAFAAGGLVMLAIGLCYAEVTPMLPVAGGEVAYAYRAWGTDKAFVIGWFLAFGYIAVSAFEAISVGRVISFMVPAVDRWPLYEVGGAPVYGGHLLLAVASTGLITALNYAGVRWVGAFQTWLTVAFLAAAVTFVGAGFAGGSLANARPWLPGGGGLAAAGGILAVLVTVPFWFVGFDTIPQGAEEADAAIPPARLGSLILSAIGAAVAFYILLILSVSMVGPWRDIVQSALPTARAFELAFASPVWSRLILLAALIGLFTSWNGFFLAGSRVLFALGRGRIIPTALGETHPRFGTPHRAVLLTGGVTVLAPLLGRDALLAVVNVGSFCIGVAFLGVSLSVRRLREVAPDLARPYRMPAPRVVPWVAATGALGMLLVMVVPGSPGALRWPMEILILLGVFALGVGFWVGGRRARATVSEPDRAHLILEQFAGPAGKESR